MAQSEFLESEQRRQFGIFTGRTSKDEVVMKEPRRVDLLDRPDCLEDVFGLVEACVGMYPQGVRGFWREAVELRGDVPGEGKLNFPPTLTICFPSH